MLIVISMAKQTYKNQPVDLKDRRYARKNIPVKNKPNIISESSFERKMKKKGKIQNTIHA